MHEYKVTKEIIEIALKSREENHKSDPIKEIALIIGENSGFIGESINMYFEVIVNELEESGEIEKNVLSNTKISITPIKAKLKCAKCGNLFERERFSFSCPKCGGDGLPTNIGKEFKVEKIIF